MQVPSRAELERFFGEERAADVQFVETVASWPSLRVLDFLYADEPATTGEVARSLNMDMREVKDRLEALEAEGVVAESEHGWRTATDHIMITFEGEDRLSIERTTEATDERVEPAPTGGSESTDEGMLSRATGYVRSLFQ
jgi:DNA-binding MarR family transcriptional regulator